MPAVDQAHAGSDHPTEPPWLDDEPISRPEEDLLGREAFVERLAVLLDAVARRPTSTVVGLVGPWGSGKSSTLALLSWYLGERRAAVEWSVVQVQPWAPSGPGAVIEELLTAVRSALPRKARRARRAVGGLVRVVAPMGVPLLPVALAHVPLVGVWLARLAWNSLTLPSHKRTSQDELARVSEQVARTGARILLVVEDVDRLQPDELLALFKGIRVLGRLPNVHYVVAYDERTVLGLLQRTPVASGAPDRALAFLDKIVTSRVDQPPVTAEHVDALLRRRMSEAFHELGVVLTPEEEERLRAERSLLLARVLEEPRSVARYVNQLKTYLPLVGVDAVDVVDFSVLTLFRLRFPQVYEALARDLPALTSRAGTPESDEVIRRWASFEVDGHPAPEVARSATLSQALRRLLPSLALDPDDRAGAFFQRTTHRAPRRLSDPDYVDRYLELGGVGGDVSDAQLREALAAWEEGLPASAVDAVHRVLHPPTLDHTALMKSARVLRRLADWTQHAPPQRASALLRVALALLPLPTGDGLDADPRGALIAWVAELLSVADVDALPPLLDSPVPRELVGPRLEILTRAEQFAFNASSPDRITANGDELARRVWAFCLDNMRAGDRAPEEPTARLLTWMRRRAPRNSRDQIRQALDDGVTVPDLLARYVEAKGPQRGVGRLVVDVEEVVRTVGLHRLRDAEDDLRPSSRASPS